MTLDLSADARTQLDWLSRGDVSAVDLLEAHIARYEAENPKLNAVIAVDLNAARTRAAALDALLAEGRSAGPLHGLPMTIKDVFDVDGLPAVCGAPEFANREAKVEDAELVQRLKAAGAIIWGKTNTPYMAGDVQTYNKVYGVTNNPHDLSRTPGGSSGGAAAALAAGITPIEVGSDIGGSLRTPAHFCGICSLKPSYGLVPLTGHVPPEPGNDEGVPDLAVAGPMARSVADLQLLLSVLAPDHPRGELPSDLATCRVTIWNEDAAFKLGKECAGAVAIIEQIAQKAGAKVSKAKPDIDSAHLIDTYQRLLMSIITSGLPAIVRFGMHAVKPIAHLFARKGEFSQANTIISATQSPAKLAEAQAERDKMRAACATFFKSHDVLITPVTPIPAFTHQTDKSLFTRKIDIDGTTEKYAALFDWIALATLCYLPAAVIPVTTTADGLPIGVQIIGAEGQDAKVLAIAALFEAALAGSTAA